MRIFAGLLLALLVCSCGETPKAPEPAATATATPRSGEDIVAEFIKRENAPYRKDHVRFTIKDKEGTVEVNEIDVWRRQTGDTIASLSIVTKPQEDAGSGSLAIEEKGKPAVNIIYSSALDEYRESDTGKMFFGGLTVQELLGEWGKYNFKMLNESPKGFEVEGKLKEGQVSVIDSMKVTFDRQNYLPVEMQLFDSSGKQLRTYKNLEIGNANGRPYLSKTAVTNHIYHSEITIEITSREFPETISDSMFARETLKQAKQKKGI